MTSDVKKDECLELKNINYQTMLLNNKSNINSKTHSDCTGEIDNFLMKEQEINKKKTWGKLSKANKLKKLIKYSKVYGEKNNLSEELIKKLQGYFVEELGKKKLQKVKDVIYDIEKGEIKNIPKLVFLRERKKFTIKRDKKTSTLRCLAPKKTQKNKKIKKNRKKTKDIVEKIIKEKKEKKKKKKSKTPLNSKTKEKI